MVRKCQKNRSKRITCHKRYKIIKKVREHHRKLRKEAKKNLNRPARKDPGVPNNVPFKEEFLKHVEDTKTQLNEIRMYNLTHMSKKNSATHTHPTVQQEVGQVIKESDVILEVVDARDPMGTRCLDLEEKVMLENKRLVIVLNKTDLIPRSNLQLWLNYLRQSKTVLPFRSNTQHQMMNLSVGRANWKVSSEEERKKSNKGLGVEELLSLLANYSHNSLPESSNRDSRLGCITVGVVGLPNTGKSALINTLKRQKVCTSGNLPGLTRQCQRVRLDKNIYLLDSPGILISKSNDPAESALKNCIRPELLTDPVPAVEAILRRLPKHYLIQKYKIDEYDDVNNFLTQLAHRLGRLKRGGIPHVSLAARSLINDWICGRIAYCSQPPESIVQPEVNASFSSMEVS